LEGVLLFPEIDGTVSKLGSFEEILEICSHVKHAWPCIDLAHHHARNSGCLREKKDFSAIIDAVEEKLGEEALKYLHFHYSPVEWNERGEQTHKAINDIVPQPEQLSLFDNDCKEDIFYLPRYEPFIEVVYERGLFPVIISETKDSQDEGALMMKRYYQGLNKQVEMVGA
jgi:deoxyribonuclease-4